MSRRPGVAARALLVVIRAYQRWISPALPPRCRYYPSCSTYAATALRTHGAFRGSRLAMWRVLRCQPFSAGGVDEVPPARGTKHDPSALSLATGSTSASGPPSTAAVPRAVISTPNQGVPPC